MPKLFGTNILIILLAAVLFYFLGALWYGGIFQEQWMELTGITDAEAQANMTQAMIFGFIIALLQAIGLAGIMSMKSEGGLGTGLRVGALTWMFFGLPVTAYSWNYENGPTALLQIDAGYLLLGYLLMGAVYGLLRK